MEENKLETITKLFEGNEIRSIWNKEEEDYYFSVVDVIAALTNSPRPRKYWNALKNKLNQEGSQVSQKLGHLKMISKDGKMRNTDVLNTEGMLRLIESVPSPRAEPFKMWLASLGKERIDEIYDPEKAISRAINYYRNKGYSNRWIEARLKAIFDRNKLTDIWKNSGIEKAYEYAVLTNEIYKVWSGMKASEYKEFKGIRKESLRDNMTRIEVILTDLGEAATEELIKEHKPYGLKQNKKVAHLGGKTAKVARDDLEKKLGKSIVSNKNNLLYKYENERRIK